MDGGLRPLYVSQQEAELILDSFKVTSPLTRSLALKAAGLVLEFMAAEAVSAASTDLVPVPPPASA